MHDRFLRACRREPTDVTPVWFMRQAGRYMAEYRALRQKHTLLDICRTPELALEVTLQPLRLGMDAAILFADILLPLEPMGAPFEFAKGEGPVIHEPVRDRAAIERLRVFEPEEGLGHVLEAVRLIRRELDGKTPLIGFAGAPFTIASYLIEGGKSSDYRLTKQLMWSDPASWSLLMSKISEVVRLFLHAQVKAGAQAVQLFDSWVGSLSIQDYREHVAPHVQYILRDLETTGVPVIHFGTNTASLLEEQRAAGGTVIGVDWRTPLGKAWERIGHDRAVQGNLDPLLLCAPREVAEQRARAVLAEAAGRPGHIFNLGHGIIPETPVDNVKAIIDLVHSLPVAELRAAAAGSAP
ncbi:uroporphyrinogen decarboxylase [Chondromyces crocatus]|uniref:Uroporphyrinogen decarboxylase n=1 Tax=Chondromyces crocatus TaxID=52 RepID=A0A0K1E535_CHOCO|nr:uroporphyrinogen decarboxylase [Chondromyces crocatus]AKT35991.1 uroporphyrinogen decarboxylase [Chondromyces crocatus]